ncbi:hypothetical protein KL919_004080 [Ogataea angusta]|nr:hypothetical protein KL919_004080 [Ogataea angusta]
MRDLGHRHGANKLPDLPKIQLRDAIAKYSITFFIPYLLPRYISTLVGGPADDFSEIAVEDVVEVFLRALEVDTDERERWLGKEIVDLLERPALGLDHKQQLVDPADGRNAPVEAQREPRVGERVPHVGEVVRDDEGPQVEHGAGRGAEEAHVEDDTGEVQPESGRPGDRQLVRDSDKDEADEEARKHGVGPEPAAAVVHVQDGRDGAEQQGAAADKRHEDGVFLVEADRRHQRRHVVHDGVDTRELAKEDHDVGVDKRPARSWVRDEVHPLVFSREMRVLELLLLERLDHVEELHLVGHVGDVSEPFPDRVRRAHLVLVDKVSRRLWQEKHADEQQRREKQRRAQNVSPRAVERVEHGCYGVAKHLAERDVELVQRHKVASELCRSALRNIGRNDRLQADSKANEKPACVQALHVRRGSTQNAAHRVRDTRHHDGQSSAQKLVERRQENAATHGSHRHQSTHQRLLVRGERQGGNKRHLGTGNERLVNTRQHAAQRRETRQHAHHMFFLLELESVAGLEHESVPERVVGLGLLGHDLVLLEAGLELLALRS